MNITNIASPKLKDIRYWLLGIAGGLQAICLTLVWKADDSGHFGMSLLFLFAIGSLIWEKRHTFKYKSEILPSIVGMGLISWVLWESANLADGNIMRLLPFASAFGVALLASGFKGLKQYWQELVILFFLGVPSVIASFLFDISPLTAQFSAIDRGENQLTKQVEFARSNQQFNLLKKSIKWNLGALVASALFITIWRSTIWARRG